MGNKSQLIHLNFKAKFGDDPLQAEAVVQSCSIKTAVLKKSAKFTGNHLQWSSFSVLKWDSIVGVLL